MPECKALPGPRGPVRPVQYFISFTDISANIWTRHFYRYFIIRGRDDNSNGKQHWQRFR